jgi:hypothetical protein
MVADAPHAGFSGAIAVARPRRGLRPEFELPWLAVAAVTLALSGTVVAVEGALRVPNSIETQVSVHASMLAALLLAHSAVLYLTHAFVGWRTLGRVASALALAGAAGVVGASLVRFIEAGWLAPKGVLHYASHYEALTWFVALAAFAYLLIEDVYRTRVAGGFVMPAVAAAMGMAAWLMSAAPTTDVAFTALMERYVSGAWRCALLVATGSFVVMSIVSLGRWFVSALARSPEMGRAARNTESLLFPALVVGVCALTLALLFDAARHLIPHWSAPSAQREAGLLAQWLILVTMIAAWRSGRRSGSLVAGGALLALALTFAGLSGESLGGAGMLETR